MIIAGHQPNYLPNLAFFEKMCRADRFVLVTNLQFGREDAWQRRNRIPGANNDVWLTVPVLGSQDQLLRDAQINESSPWRRKHQRSLRLTYAKTTNQDLLSALLAIYDRPWERLVDLDVALIRLMREALGISTPLVLDEEVSGTKQELLVQVAKKYGATTYLSGGGARAYLGAEEVDWLAQQGLGHAFVETRLAESHPYSAIHYLLTDGPEAMRLVSAADETRTLSVG